VGQRSGQGQGISRPEARLIRTRSPQRPVNGWPLASAGGYSQKRVPCTCNSPQACVPATLISISAREGSGIKPLLIARSACGGDRTGHSVWSVDRRYLATTLTSIGRVSTATSVTNVRPRGVPRNAAKLGWTRWRCTRYPSGRQRRVWVAVSPSMRDRINVRVSHDASLPFRISAPAVCAPHAAGVPNAGMYSFPNFY
jgi:hypothetical protein